MGFGNPQFDESKTSQETTNVTQTRTSTERTSDSYNQTYSYVYSPSYTGGLGGVGNSAASLSPTMMGLLAVLGLGALLLIRR